MPVKVAVSTYCTWTSYGSILQSYALKCVLKKYHCDSFIIKTKQDKSPFESKKISFKQNKLKEIFVNIFNLFCFHDFFKQYKKSIKFIDSNFDFEFYDNYEMLLKNPPVADKYLTGSDQVFNPLITRPSFFLDFVKDRSKRITYACSMGELNIPEQQKDNFKKLINNLDLISVREKDNIDIIKRFTNAKTFVNIDPTFLLTKEEWSNVEGPYRLKKDYILVYPLYWNKEYNKDLKMLHKKTGLDICVICSGFNGVWGTKKLYDVGLQEFVWLIHNAKYVITSSFHGVAMSTIFNKQFSAIINPDAPSRISSILDLLEIDKIQINELLTKQINYERVNKNIVKEREKSIKYLKKVLEIDE